MPVYFFAVSQVPHIIWWKTAMIFVILHFLIYPASHGYNSYMDRDEGSIGLLRHPPPPDRRLFRTTLFFDLLALACSAFAGLYFLICALLYIAASRAYSFRGIRLKKYPVAGWLTVFTFQGAVVFLMVYAGASADNRFSVPWMGMLASSLLFGGFYPLTQIYQHEQDLNDGVKTISYILGYRGSFWFSVLLFAAAQLCLWIYFNGRSQPQHFLLLQFFFLPVLVYFLYWFAKVWINTRYADYHHTMSMNTIAAVCMNSCFITLFILNHLE